MSLLLDTDKKHRCQRRYRRYHQPPDQAVLTTAALATTATDHRCYWPKLPLTTVATGHCCYWPPLLLTTAASDHGYWPTLKDIAIGDTRPRLYLPPLLQDTTADDTAAADHRRYCHNH